VSRIGKKPIVVPQGVKVDIHGTTVKVKGPKGELERSFADPITIALEDGHVNIARPSDEPSVRALHGTTRAVLQNMVTGVSTGFTKALQIEGVGYRA
jgi:large subunit ribosomal protein L6